MPETASGREAILKYLDDNDVSTTSLAKMFGVSWQYMEAVLSGEKTSKGANKLILLVIDRLGIK